jgi:hypothetical protein
MPDDHTADAARLGAADVRGLPDLLNPRGPRTLPLHG